MIELRDIVVRRGSFVLGPVSLKLEPGECLVIAGPSGAGKTLLVETVLGVHTPAGGRVIADGRDVTDVPPERRGFSYLPQDLALFTHLSVEENVAFALRGRLGRSEVVARAREIAARVGIEHLLGRRSVEGLSGGERQRVALARALAVEPRALFLDEPFNALDPALRSSLRREFGELRRARGLTTVLVTHDLDEALALGDRMAVLVNGKLEQVGSVEEVYARPATLEVARLLLVENLLPASARGPAGEEMGHPGAAWAGGEPPPGAAEPRTAESPLPAAGAGTWRYDVGGIEIVGPAPPATENGGGFVIGVRAQHVRLMPNEAGQGSSHALTQGPGAGVQTSGATARQSDAERTRPGAATLLRGAVRQVWRGTAGRIFEVAVPGAHGSGSPAVTLVAAAPGEGPVAAAGDAVACEIAAEHVVVLPDGGRPAGEGPAGFATRGRAGLGRAGLGRALLALLAAALLFAAPGCGRGCGDGRKIVRVLAADALATSMTRLEEAFERENPDIDLRVIVEGSVMLLRLHLLHPADIVILADDRLIEESLRPDDADWLVAFATTEMVIARTEASRHAERIDAENWPEILLAPGVLVGRADPAIDPCGYYARVVFQLAEKRHAGGYPRLASRLEERSSAEYQRPDALSVLALLQTRAIDYAFVYRSHAVDHRLPYVRLPDSLNLGDPSQVTAYADAEVEVPDYRGHTKRMRGHPIFLALTVPRRAREPGAALRLARFMLSEKGRDILARSEFRPLVPPRVPDWASLPAALADVTGGAPPAVPVKREGRSMFHEGR